MNYTSRISPVIMERRRHEVSNQILLIDDFVLFELVAQAISKTSRDHYVYTDEDFDVFMKQYAIIDVDTNKLTFETPEDKLLFCMTFGV
jgi:hypothetical protein